MVAMSRKNPKVALRLLEIAIEQYTPFPTKKDESKNSPVINNYELANLMMNFQVILIYFFLNFKPGQFFNRAALSLETNPDPNAPTIQLNCIISPAKLLHQKSD